ncbi:MAG: hypothetical protein ACI89L_001044 [Phycisphaerales bacterium]|jgi:uncharacterized protein (TIGR01244 family)
MEKKLKPIRAAVTCVFASILLGGCAAGPVAEAPKPPRVMEFEDFMTFESAPGVYFAGQPSPSALAEFKAVGGTTVINLRTEKELAFYPYYNMACESQGFTHTNVECSGSTMSHPEYDAFLDAYKGVSEPVLIHCASGGRARMMWAAYEQQELGLSREEVLANAAARGQDSEKMQELIGSMLDRLAADPVAEEAPESE